MAEQPDLSRVNALGDAALALERKGHFARAAEKYCAALDAARALAQPDCLVVVSLQLASVNVLTCIASGADSGADRAAAVASLFAQQNAAIEALQRRLAAGTLLAGCCRPYEVAWYDNRTSAVARDGGKPPSAAGKAEWATLIGFDALLRAANNILQEVLFSQRGADASEMQRCALVVAALDAMTARSDAGALAVAEALGRPRLLWTANQSALVASFGEAMARRALEADTPAGAALLAAWGRLQATGALAAFGGSVDAHASQIARVVAARDAAHAAAAAAQRRTCALPSCGAREQHASHFKSCAACRIPAYCSKEHQTEHWPDHKAACKAARKAAAAN